MPADNVNVNDISFEHCDLIFDSGHSNVMQF